MTDITKLLDEHPLPWTLFHPWMETPDVVVDASGQCVRLTPSIVLAIADALHAERQKRKRVPIDLANFQKLEQLDTRIGRAFEMIGDLERIVRDGERLEAIEKRLDAIANAARGDEA